jgi:hypothetical protein
MSPVSNVFGVSSRAQATAGPTSAVSGSLQANYGPPGGGAGASAGGKATLKSTLGGAITFNTLCFLGLIFYYYILP